MRWSLSVALCVFVGLCMWCCASNQQAPQTTVNVTEHTTTEPSEASEPDAYSMPEPETISSVTAGGYGSRGSRRHAIVSGSAPDPIDAVIVPETPPESEEAEPVSEVDQALSNLRVGNIAFNPPSVMGLEETHSVELYLSLEEEIEDLVASLDGGSVETAEGIKVANVMEASLTGSGFVIHATTPLAQAVGSKGRTRWAWDVTPKGEGAKERKLHVTLSARLKVEGENTPHVVQTFSRTIRVQVTPWGRAKRFVVKHWVWLWSAIISPLGIWLFAWWRKKRKLVA